MMQQTTKRKDEPAAKTSVLDAGSNTPDEHPLEQLYRRPDDTDDEPPLPESSPPHAHKPKPRIEIYGIDEDTKKRLTRYVDGRTPRYRWDCEGCRYDDRKRMATAPTITEYEMERTLFLVPEAQYDQRVAREYLRRRYGNVDHRAVSQVNLERMGQVKSARIVVVTRRGRPGRPIGAGITRTMDREGVWREVEVPPETYLRDIVESAPIVVDEAVEVTSANMFADRSIDLGELVARLGEVASPYRIACPAHKDDKMYVMRKA